MSSSYLHFHYLSPNLQDSYTQFQNETYLRWIFGIPEGDACQAYFSAQPRLIANNTVFLPYTTAITFALGTGNTTITDTYATGPFSSLPVTEVFTHVPCNSYQQELWITNDGPSPFSATFNTMYPALSIDMNLILASRLPARSSRRRHPPQQSHVYQRKLQWHDLRVLLLPQLHYLHLRRRLQVLVAKCLRYARSLVQFLELGRSA